MLRHEGVKRERRGGGKRANEESIEYRVWSIGDECRFGWRVTATRASAPRESAFQLSAIGFGFPWLAPERPDPELLVSVAVTRHLIICPPANLQSPISL